MKSLKRILTLSFALCLGSSVLSAQDSSAPADSSGGGSADGANSNSYYQPSGSTQTANISSGLVAGNYVLQPLDVIQVDVFQEPELQVQSRLSADGTVSLPLIGEVNLGGMTVDNAQKLITKAYKGDYLINPHVTILVLQYTERFIYVHGMVNKPGPVPIPPERELTLSEAVNSAGGLSRLARRGNVRVRRMNEQGKVEVITIDFDEILESPEVSDIKLKDGDHVIVSERII